MCLLSGTRTLLRVAGLVPGGVLAVQCALGGAPVRWGWQLTSCSVVLCGVVARTRAGGPTYLGRRGQRMVLALLCSVVTLPGM